ncbi:MAG TPA: carboxypeptidase-like regulatory domain-containing protein [Blastocatellia bacterium]|nr:carboxypeptidase-like regulatory domain-containing protein [Blastocatellia bacterium]
MRRTLFRIPRVASLALLLASLSSVASAQFKASIQGTITDSNGAVVSGAKVTLINKETARKTEVTASGDGFYRFSALAPGAYKLTVERDGFKKKELENITIGAETIGGIDVVMETGVVTETVTISGEDAQALEKENANISGAISTLKIRQLPQVGRDPYELLRLAPGVFGDGARAGNGNAVNLPNTTGPGGSNNSIFQTENQVQISANGQRLSSNNFQIDGVSVNSFNWGGAALVTPNQESVKEIRVTANTYSAEDGRNSGAQIQVVSQNGTNNLHGSAVLKYNSPKLNAFNKYGGPNNAARVRVNDYLRQFGGSLGGPLPLPRFGEGGRATFWGKNKSFFFFSYEGLRNSSNNVGMAYVETPQFRQLVLQQRPNSVTAKVLSANGVEPRILNILTPSCGIYNDNTNRCRIAGNGLDIGSLTGATGQYIPLGNPIGGGLDGIPDIQQVQFALPGRNHANQYNLRLDFTPTEKDTLVFSTYLTKLDNFGSDSGAQGRPIADIPLKPFNSSGTLLYNRIFSATLLNEARFNATRFKIDQLKDATDVNFGIPRVEVEGLPIGDRIRFGAVRGEGTPGVFAQNIFEFSDTLSKTRGNHAMKFGVVARKEQDNSNLSGGSRPVYSFSGLFNLANDAPIFEGVNADPRTGNPADAQFYFRTPYYAGFAMDSWKVRPNLTLNLGVRYEYFSPLTEKKGRLANLFFTPGNLTAAQVRPVDRLYEPDKNNFAPRFSFAFSPRWKVGKLFDGDRSVIRGGFGVAYNRVPVAPLNNARGNPPFFARYGLCCGTASTDFGTPFANGTILYAVGSSNALTSYPRNPALGRGIDPVTGGAIGGAVEIYGVQQDVRTPYVYIYSLEVQYELPYAMTATAGYQASAGHKLIRLTNQNFLYRNSPAFFASYFSMPDTNSNFNALLLNLTRRFSKGLSLEANYRFSKSIDQLSYEGPGFVTNQTYPQDNSTERGPSDYDVRHFFTLHGIYDLPFFTGSDSFAAKAFGGWRISGILTKRTGFPFTPIVGGFTSTPGGPSLCPVRPQGYTGPSDIDTSNDAFINGTNFPGGGAPFFVVVKQPDGSIAPPGIGRNSFRGPKYFNVDFSLMKQTRLPKLLGEGARLELRANFFNIFNKLNLGSFNFGSNAATIGNFDAGSSSDPGRVNNNPNFGKATTGLAGRVIELQARFSF